MEGNIKMSIEFIRYGQQTSDKLDRLRSENDPVYWEQLTNEKASRRSLLKTKEMTEKLVNAAILGIIQARKTDNNKVALMPILGKDGLVHCVICNTSPVICAIIIPTDTKGN
jgi:hypothetical protein